MKRSVHNGWLRLLPGPALLLMVVLSACGQGSFFYQRFYTDNPDPNFPWDYEGQRILSLYPASMSLDLNHDGTADYVIATGGAQSSLGFYIYGLQAQNKVWAYAPFDSDFVVALAGGDAIGEDVHASYDWYGPVYANGHWVGSTYTASVGELSAGMFTGVASAYCGLQMQLDGQTHYGWVRVGSPIGLNGGWVYDAVFNTMPGQSLLAGQGAPEPGTWAMLLVGGLGIFLTRGSRLSN